MVKLSTLTFRKDTQDKGVNPAPNGGLLIEAVAELKELPIADDQGCWIVPSEPRLMCEKAIEHISNLISVLEGCSRSVMSPVPCLALEHINKTERELLESGNGIQSNAVPTDSGFRMPIARSQKVLDALSDRMNGVALLSEAYSGGGESSRYREFVRFFELAFKMPSSNLGKKLTQFLSQSPMGYTRQEIDAWLNLRDPHSHADFQKSKVIAVATDIRQYLLRMEQACLDVLFNKRDWMDRSRTRRVVWTPEAISTSATGGLIVREGATSVSMLFRSYDEFGVFPRDLNAMIIDGLSENLYCKFVASEA